MINPVYLAATFAILALETANSAVAGTAQFQRPVLAMSATARQQIEIADAEVQQKLDGSDRLNIAPGSEIYAVQCYVIRDPAQHRILTVPMTATVRQTSDGVFVFVPGSQPSKNRILKFSDRTSIGISPSPAYVYVPPGSERPLIVFTRFAKRVR